MEIVINASYEPYCLSPKAYEYLGLSWDYNGMAFIGNRTHPQLLSCIKNLGQEASWAGSKLKIVDIPDNIDWEMECDGCREWISEKHRIWD